MIQSDDFMDLWDTAISSNSLDNNLLGIDFNSTNNHAIIELTENSISIDDVGSAIRVI